MFAFPIPLLGLSVYAMKISILRHVTTQIAVCILISCREVPQLKFQMLPARRTPTLIPW